MVIKNSINVFTISENQQSKENKIINRERFNWFLYLTAFVVNLSSIAAGISYAWSSPAIPKLKIPVPHEDNPLTKDLTLNEESWIASFLPVGALFGAFTSGALFPSIGKKKTLLITITPIILSNIIVAFSTNAYIFYVGRFLAGITVGASTTVIPLYLCEIAELNNRGSLGCMYSTFLSIGNLYSYVIGPCLDLTTFSLSCLWASVGFFVIFPFFPDTVLFYLDQKNEGKASKVLQKFRTTNSDEEFNQIQSSFVNKIENNENSWVIFKQKSFRKGLVICLSLIAFQQFSGISIIIFYMQSIFDSTDSSISSYISTVAVAIVQLIFCVISVMIVDKLGRKVLLLYSAFGTVLALILLGAYFYFQANEYNMDFFSLLPIGSILLHMAAYNVGFGPVPFAILGEIFPPTPIASTLTAVTCLSLTFFTTKFFPSMVNLIGQHYSFWLLAIIMIIAMIFIVVFVPETKGKSLKEIMAILEQ
ncbi:facilitated trehalose transporter Tret1-like [Onthophagus taurus]|uniref:facilitated trehalose transporter Tret1-like n=1 Tax=Onthophagus taurus TaxID=166361 RepID=UPI000C204CAF|nr:facilitated trehalose transporter Tret1-like [Onthophagus taurus]